MGAGRWAGRGALCTLTARPSPRRPALQAPPLAATGTPLPVVVFSHGLGGHRAVYSIICGELASQGYVVLAVEHADGTASAARLAGGRGWRFYQGLGGEEGQVGKTRQRVEEMRTALAALRGLHRGEAAAGLALGGGLRPGAFLAGALDLRCVAAIGHSYGGATAASLCAEDPDFRCALAYDPWWAALPSESAALRRWKTSTPLLVMGSHDW
jgi:platelet-activating factor acetylhydrolase